MLRIILSDICNISSLSMAVRSSEVTDFISVQYDLPKIKKGVV
jgi:hypothetical protein